MKKYENSFLYSVPYESYYKKRTFWITEEMKYSDNSHQRHAFCLFRNGIYLFSNVFTFLPVKLRLSFQQDVRFSQNDHNLKFIITFSAWMDFLFIWWKFKKDVWKKMIKGSVEWYKNQSMKHINVTFRIVRYNS